MKRKILNCIVIAVIVVNAMLIMCGCGSSSKHSKEYFDLLKAGDRAQEAGNYEDALSAYQKAIEMNPAVPQAYHRMFDTYVRDERFDDALQFALDNYQSFSTKMTAQSDVTYQDDAAYQSDSAGEESSLYVNMTPRQETALFFVKAMDLGLHRGAALKNVYPQNEMSEFVTYVFKAQDAIDDEELTEACADVTDTGSKYSDIVDQMREAGVLVSADLSELSPKELLEQGLGDPAPETLMAMEATNNGAADQTTPGAANAGAGDQTTPGTANNGEAGQTTPGTDNAGAADQTTPGAASTGAASQITPGTTYTVTANLITLESADSFEKELRALLAEDPDLIFLYFDIANLYIQAGDRERAAAVYQEGQQALTDMLSRRGYITEAAVPLIEDQFSNLYCLGYAASADSIGNAGTTMTTEQYKEALEEARSGVEALPLSEEERSAVRSSYEMYNGQLDECIEINLRAKHSYLSNDTHPEVAVSSNDWFYVPVQHGERIYRISKDRRISEDTGILSGGEGSLSNQYYDGKLYVSAGVGFYVYDEASGACDENISTGSRGNPRQYEWQIYEDKLYYTYWDQNDKYFLNCADLSGKQIGEPIALNNNPNYYFAAPQFFIKDSYLYYTEFIPAKEQENIGPSISTNFRLDTEHMSSRIWRVPLDGGKQEIMYTGMEGYSLHFRDISSEYLAIVMFKERANCQLILLPLKNESSEIVVAEHDSVYNNIVDAHFYNNTVLYTVVNMGLYQYDLETKNTRKLTEQIYRAFSIIDDYCYMERFDVPASEETSVWYSLTSE